METRQLARDAHEDAVRVSKSFYHDRPLIKRSEVSLDRELEDPLPLPLRKLSRADGEKLVSLGRDMMTVRYRELMHANEPVHSWPLD